jgi:formamidopyrimidine-DNA glycosylase
MQSFDIGIAFLSNRAAASHHWRVYVPELPEVETVRSGLHPLIQGAAITAVAITDFPGVLGDLPIEVATSRMTGRPIRGVERRGKFLIIPFEDGDGIIAHLRMTGVLTLDAPGTPAPRFHRLTLSLDNGNELRFSDQRKFGRIAPASSSDIAALSARLGPEPFSEDFSNEYLAAALRNRSASIKSLLLDQRIIAGLGNIYVDEALFLARIYPGRAGGSLSANEQNELRLRILDVLRAGIEHRGVSFSSFKDVYGHSGENQQHLVVYGRGNHGYPCLRCGGVLKRMVIGGRGTSYCPECQPAG